MEPMGVPLNNGVRYCKVSCTSHEGSYCLDMLLLLPARTHNVPLSIRIACKNFHATYENVYTDTYIHIYI